MKCKCVFPQQEVGIHKNMYINVCGGYDSVGGSALIFTLVDICISSPPDRASPSITADPIVELRAHKQPGNDGALQPDQQQWLINIHIPPLKPFDAYLCFSHISTLMLFISARRTWSVSKYLMRTVTFSLTVCPPALLNLSCYYLDG